MSDQTTLDLAAALDAFDTCLPDVRRVLIDVDTLRLAAQRLRALNAVKEAAEIMASVGHHEECEMFCGEGEECECGLDDLRAALARIKGGA